MPARPRLVVGSGIDRLLEDLVPVFETIIERPRPRRPGP